MRIIRTSAYKLARSRAWDDNTHPGPPSTVPGPTRQVILDDPGDSESDIIDLWRKKQRTPKTPREEEDNEMPKGML